DGSSETPVELSAGAWSVRERFATVATLTATWIGGDRHLDVLGAARWTGRRVELEARAGARPWTTSDGDVGEAVAGLFGEVSALVSLGSRVALALSGGSYPADPVRRVLAATYVTAGLRLALFGPNELPSPAIAGATIAALREDEPSGSKGAARLEIALSGQPRTFRLHIAGAAAVELMGDFTDWQTVALARVDTEIWEIKLPVSPGVHRLNVRIDGGPWLVPVGARSESGEFGDAVGVVVVR
ncbi:MAG: glycogen-binding domain-containing protein, partial [Longimicrobiales bacterium]